MKLSLYHLLGEVIVKILSGLSSQANQEFIKVARCVDHLRFEKVLPQ